VRLTYSVPTSLSNPAVSEKLQVAMCREAIEERKMASGSSNKALPTKRKPQPMDAWEHNWLEHWSKAGTAGYELPKTGAVGAEAAF